MKSNEIRIQIKAPKEQVFEFSVNPVNTPKWVEGLQQESIDTKQIGIGTIYSNDYGSWVVTDYEKNIFFELTNPESSCRCSYSYRSLEDGSTELVYFEFMEDESELKEAMQKKAFEKLKELLEK